MSSQALNISKLKDFSSLPGQPAPGIYHPHSEKISLIATCAFFACACLWEESGSLFYAAFHWVGKDKSQIPWELNTPSSCSLSLTVPASGLLGCTPLLYLQYVHVFLVQGGTKLDTALQMLSHKCQIEGINLFRWPAGCALAYMALICC